MTACTRFIVFTLSTCTLSAVALASEDPSGPPPAASPSPVATVRDRWENGLDVKLTDAYERKGSDVESPTVVLAAQWNYKFVTDTFLGGTISGFPQSMRLESDDPAIKRSFSAYWGGLNLGQGIFDAPPFRLVLTLAAGKGYSYVRTQPEGEPSSMHGGKFDFYEPGLFATFYTWHGLEMGAVASYRVVKLEKEDDDVGESSDLSAMAYGLTFRTQRY